jgi:hypothetical protein
MKTDFKTLLSSFLPALKRFPYAFGLIFYFLVIGSIQILATTQLSLLFFQLDVLKTLGFIFLVGTIGIRIAFENLITAKNLKLPFKLQGWYDHLASGVLGLLLVIFGLLNFLAPSALLTLEIALLWYLVLFFLPFAPFVVKGIKVPDYLLFLVTKNIVLGFFIFFLAAVIPLTINILLGLVFRIEIGDALLQITNITALIVTYGFGIPYFINQLPIDENYEKDIKNQHPFFRFLYGTLIPVIVFNLIIGVFGLLGFIGEVLNSQENVGLNVGLTVDLGPLEPLITNGIFGILVVPVLVVGHVVFFSTLPLKATHGLSKLFHLVFPFVAAFLTLILFSETSRAALTEFAWELSPLIVLNLVVASATGYLTFLYFINKLQLPVRQYYLVFIFAVLVLMVLIPFTNLTALDAINALFYETGLIA